MGCEEVLSLLGRGGTSPDPAVRLQIWGGGMMRRVMEPGGNPKSISPGSVGNKDWGAAPETLESTPDPVGKETSTEVVLSSLRTWLWN